MQIWISKPHGALLGGQEENLRRRWTMAAKYASAGIEFIEADRHEIHGQLMQRMWETRIRPSDDAVHLISELDFVPTRSCAQRLLEQARTRRLSLLGVDYVNRVYQPGEMPSRRPGNLQRFSERGFPLLAPWLLLLDLSRGSHRDLPLDWLREGGPKNDASNMALAIATELGFLGPGKGAYALLQGRDAWPLIHGVWYPKLGVHAFFARALDLPAATPICWSEQPNTLTAGQHRDNLRMMLH